MEADFDEAEEVEDETKEGAAIRGARGLPFERLSPKQIISNLSDAESAKLGVRKLSRNRESSLGKIADAAGIRDEQLWWRS